MQETIQNANVALRFILELCALVAYGYAGWQIGSSTFLKLGLAIGLPLGAAILWGLFGAPGSSMQLQDPWHLLLEIVVFGGSAVALARTGHPAVGLVYAVVFVINRVLMYIWGQ